MSTTTTRAPRPKTPKAIAAQALKALGQNQGQAAECGMNARRAVAAWAESQSWSEAQLKKDGDGFTAITKAVEDADCSASLASKMRGFAHPRVRVQFADIEAASVRLQAAHGGAALRYLEQISSLIRKQNILAGNAEAVISEEITAKKAKDVDRERLTAFAKWVAKSAALKKKTGLLERKALEDALARVLEGFDPNALSAPEPAQPDEAVPFEPEPAAAQPATPAQVQPAAPHLAYSVSWS